MGVKKTHPKILIVEGNDDLFSVVGLMEHHMDWPDGVESCPVFIEPIGGVTEILEKGFLTGKVKESRIQIMGVMLDADENGASNRYRRLRELLLPVFPNLPNDMPADGLIDENADKKRLGIWVMPDNKAEGCMEDFLHYLVPTSSKPIWDHAVDSVAKGRSMGAPCKDCHLPKAELFTWLAWQDEPGYSPGLALTKKILDPQSPHAQPFVDWFKKLFHF